MIEEVLLNEPLKVAAPLEMAQQVCQGLLKPNWILRLSKTNAPSKEDGVGQREV